MHTVLLQRTCAVVLLQWVLYHDSFYCITHTAHSRILLTLFDQNCLKLCTVQGEVWIYTCMHTCMIAGLFVCFNYCLQERRVLFLAFSAHYHQHLLFLLVSSKAGQKYAPGECSICKTRLYSRGLQQPQQIMEHHYQGIQRKVADILTAHVAARRLLKEAPNSSVSLHIQVYTMINSLAQDSLASPSAKFSTLHFLQINQELRHTIIAIFFHIKWITTHMQ